MNSQSAQEQAGSRTIPIPSLIPGASITIDNDTFQRILQFDRDRASSAPLQVALAISRSEQSSVTDHEHVHYAADETMVTYHLCRLCKRPRSNRYHKEHPITADTPPPSPGICHRCRIAADDGRHGDGQVILQSEPVKIGIACLVPETAVLTQQQMRERSGRELVRETVRYITRSRSRPNQSMGQKDRPLYRHVAPEEIAGIVRPPSIAPSPSQHSSQKTAEVSVDNLAALDTINAQADQIKDLEAKLQAAQNPSTELIVPPVAQEVCRPGYSESSIRRFARDEVVRYRQAERKVERHPEPYAHGRLVAVEARRPVRVTSRDTRTCSAGADLDDAALADDAQNVYSVDATSSKARLDHVMASGRPTEQSASAKSMTSTRVGSIRGTSAKSSTSHKRTLREQHARYIEQDIIYDRPSSSSAKKAEDLQKPSRSSDTSRRTRVVPVTDDTAMKQAPDEGVERSRKTIDLAVDACKTQYPDHSQLRSSEARSTAEAQRAARQPTQMKTMVAMDHQSDADNVQQSSRHRSKDPSSTTRKAELSILGNSDQARSPLADQDWADATRACMPTVPSATIEVSRSGMLPNNVAMQGTVVDSNPSGWTDQDYWQGCQPAQSVNHSSTHRSQQVPMSSKASHDERQSGTNKVPSEVLARQRRDARAQVILDRNTSSSGRDYTLKTQSTEKSGASYHYDMAGQESLSHGEGSPPSDEYQYEYRESVVDKIYNDEGLTRRELEAQQPDTMRISQEFYVYKAPKPHERKTTLATDVPHDFMPSSSVSQMPSASKSSMRTADQSKTSARSRRDSSSVKFAEKVHISPTPPGSDDYPPDPLVGRSEARRSERRHYEPLGPSPLAATVHRGRRSARDDSHGGEGQQKLSNRSPAEETETSIAAQHSKFRRAKCESPAREVDKLGRVNDVDEGSVQSSPERRPRVLVDRYGPYRKEERGASMEARYGSSSGRPPRGSVAEI